MRIDLHIDRLVVVDLLADGGSDSLREALEAGLARALRELDVSALPAGSVAVHRQRLALPPAAQPSEVGAGIAESIGRVLASGGAR